MIKAKAGSKRAVDGHLRPSLASSRSVSTPSQQVDVGVTNQAQLGAIVITLALPAEGGTMLTPKIS